MVSELLKKSLFSSCLSRSFDLGLGITFFVSSRGNTLSDCISFVCAKALGSVSLFLSPFTRSRIHSLLNYQKTNESNELFVGVSLLNFCSSIGA